MTDLLDQARALLTDLHAAELTAFLKEWPVSPERRTVPASSVPVLSWLPNIQRSAPAFSAPLVNPLVGVPGKAPLKIEGGTRDMVFFELAGPLNSLDP